MKHFRPPMPAAPRTVRYLVLECDAISTISRSPITMQPQHCSFVVDSFHKKRAVFIGRHNHLWIGAQVAGEGGVSLEHAGWVLCWPWTAQWYFSMCVFKLVDGISEAYRFFKAVQTEPFEVWDCHFAINSQLTTVEWLQFSLVVVNRGNHRHFLLSLLILRGLMLGKSPPTRTWQHSKLQRLSTFPDRKRRSKLCLSFDMGIGRLENHWRCQVWYFLMNMVNSMGRWMILHLYSCHLQVWVT